MENNQYREYSEALDTFLLSMERIPSQIHPDNAKALTPICDFLRIAQINIVYYDSPAHERQKEGDNIVLLSRKGFDTKRVLSFREESAENSILIINFYPFKDEKDWSDFEISKINLIEKMLFVYNERRHSIQITANQVYRDPDLSIFNLTYYMKACNQIIREGSISKYTACYFDINHYAEIIHQLGRPQATEILFKFIHLLQESLSEDELICRVGGDNFVLLFYKEKTNSILDFLNGIHLSCENDSENIVYVTTTSGFYHIQETDTTASDIVDKISFVFNLAKNVYHVPYMTYDDEMAKNIKDSKAIETMFPQALEEEEFQVFYQPKVSLKNYHLAGAEALCRWWHDGEMIMPYRFIPVLEESNNINLLDFYMLEHVCRDLRQWLDEGKTVVKVSVNFSRRHLSDANLVEHILSVINSYEIPHEYIELELTETTSEVDYKVLRQIVTGLQQAGISTSVDDFGMGYSSINLIRELPWNVLKIDKSFLDDSTDENKNRNIMFSHVISMAQEIGLECIVEGVESPEHIRLLKEHNCYLAQGFFFDKPLPKETFEDRLNAIQ